MIAPNLDNHDNDNNNDNNNEVDDDIVVVGNATINNDINNNSNTNNNDDTNQSSISDDKIEYISDIIQNAFILGGPVPVNEQEWNYCRNEVTGRLVNGYSNNDYVLGVIYRYEKWRVRVAGIAPVVIPGVENIDLSDIVKQHSDYSSKMKEILLQIL